MKFEIAQKEDADSLAKLRVQAMRESLEAVGRFDEERARQRFLSNFCPENTTKAIIAGQIVGFYTVEHLEEHVQVDHLYVHPDFQNKQIGSSLLTKIIEVARKAKKPIRLGALKESRSNQFYLSRGFQKYDEGDFDNYYELANSQ